MSGVSESFLDWLRSARFKLYCSHTLSSWGDRMWSFAIGLYMVILVPDSLLLTAIYGFVRCGAIVIFGAMVGRWVDRTHRLSAARTSILLQNFFVIICAIILCCYLWYETFFKDPQRQWAVYTIYCLIIIMTTLADLASMACKIIVEKDWIVVITEGNIEYLARLNATMRSIDLTTYILAPVVVGQVMTYISPFAAAVFMAGWNLVSMTVEYNLLRVIYKQFPKLAIKVHYEDKKKSDTTSDDVVVFDIETLNERSTLREHPKITIWLAWKLYFNHPICFAGIGLSSLYMTVLGFDSVTSGYAYSQGVSESIVGILTAVGAGFGILGSVLFPILRRKVGVERSGLFGFGSEISCLTLCVISVWAPGSPFNLSASSSPASIDPSLNTTGDFWNASDSIFGNITESPLGVTGEPISFIDQYLSIILLMTGIVLARTGLWIADLSVTQIMQEEVEESVRGVINGVQNSLNMSMDLLKFILVMVFPNWNTFGLLILLSFSVVCLGWFFYSLYSYKKRGHLFHFEKLSACIPQYPHEIMSPSVDYATDLHPHPQDYYSWIVTMKLTDH